MYEDNKQLDKAQPYYERVAAAVPDYYVVHRALGYLYLEDAKHLERAMNAAPDKATRETLMEAYEKAVRKALPHLEKAQACDPSDETLALIKMLYRNIKDNAGVASLNTSLKEMSQHCIDILQDH
jgi:tetratricopeptide (TPR) repeat protein